MKEHIITVLKGRYAVKKFDKTKKIPNDLWEMIEDAICLTPSSFGLMPWKAIVVTDEKTREKLVPASWNQPQISESSHLIVFCSKKNIDIEFIENHMKDIAKIRSMEIGMIEDYKQKIFEYMKTTPNHLEFASNQAFIALGNIISISSLLGIDTCPIGGFNPIKYDEILEVPNEYTASVVCAFGYKSNEDKYAKIQKVRRLKSEIIIKFKN